jgi:DNA-binding CsgD family transcriptional regulator
LLAACEGLAAAPRRDELLKERELQILRLIAEGKTYQEIGNTIYISLNTVQSYIRQIYHKLDVHSGLEAVARARELGLI